FLCAELMEESQQGSNIALKADIQEPSTPLVDLVNQGDIIVASAPLPNVRADEKSHGRKFILV
ncbi:MAG: hypothetical protein LAT55_12700, partial [Opitutales bacterium]|nr:hypothetical protein [Opitutales bacterium]